MNQREKLKYISQQLTAISEWHVEMLTHAVDRDTQGAATNVFMTCVSTLEQLLSDCLEDKFRDPKRIYESHHALARKRTAEYNNIDWDTLDANLPSRRATEKIDTEVPKNLMMNAFKLRREEPVLDLGNER